MGRWGDGGRPAPNPYHPIPPTPHLQLATIGNRVARALDLVRLEERAQDVHLRLALRAELVVEISHLARVVAQVVDLHPALALVTDHFVAVGEQQILLEPPLA